MTGLPFSRRRGGRGKRRGGLRYGSQLTVAVGLGILIPLYTRVSCLRWELVCGILCAWADAVRKIYITSSRAGSNLEEGRVACARFLIHPATRLARSLAPKVVDVVGVVDLASRQLHLHLC